jgi:outer membrane protein OmpA-like peptidoglycan-associated protein
LAATARVCPADGCSSSKAAIWQQFLQKEIMSDQNDENQTYALFLVGAIVFAVVAGVIGFAANRSLADRPAVATQEAAVAPTAVALAGPGERVYFEVGSAALPPDASDLLVRVAEAARASGQSVVISGYHDASGDPARNEELAKERALAVRHALEANGVAPDRLVMSKPALTTGDGDPREARRVELRLE